MLLYSGLFFIATTFQSLFFDRQGHGRTRKEIELQKTTSLTNGQFHLLFSLMSPSIKKAPPFPIHRNSRSGIPPPSPNPPTSTDPRIAMQCGQCQCLRCEYRNKCQCQCKCKCKRKRKRKCHSCNPIVSPFSIPIPNAQLDSQSQGILGTWNSWNVEPRTQIPNQPKTQDKEGWHFPVPVRGHWRRQFKGRNNCTTSH